MTGVRRSRLAGVVCLSIALIFVTRPLGAQSTDSILRLPRRPDPRLPMPETAGWYRPCPASGRHPP